jgi:oligoribonuclease
VIVFIDLETTGLNERRNAVVEVCAIVTDDVLVEVARFTRVVYWEPAAFMLETEPGVREMSAASFDVDPYVLQMHTDNGLWVASAASPHYLDVVDRDLAAIITQHCPTVGEKAGPQLAGNTISFDRAFLKEDFRATHALLHYRNLDVTALNEMARRFWPAVHAGRPRTSGNAHRAEDDCVESLETARYYAQALGPVAVVTNGPP